MSPRRHVSKHRRTGYVVELPPANLKAKKSAEVERAAIRKERQFNNQTLSACARDTSIVPGG